MQRIAIIGSGNLGVNLAYSLEKAAGLDFAGIYGRKERDFRGSDWQVRIQRLDTRLPQADCYFLALPDDSLASFTASFDFGDSLVVHHSGAKALSEIESAKHTAVFYPLQTFSADRIIGLEDVPVFLEATSAPTLRDLENLAGALGAKTHHANSEQRLRLHLAAVLANNFSNHLIYLAQNILEGSGLAGDSLNPLLEETFSKALKIGAFDAQTGPARRGDENTIARHLGLLDTPALRTLYRHLSDSIIETYSNKK
ncbi:Rossmann-like and DUF2520 domain-containing protein [Robiginitalea myxolifaciens]|uniref:Rossmann-like and DUF2520 domain-containing protein n=1 Tax=Robiginitalea myxolifaciens TaxID=400055 RepID=UPI0015A635FB|nr:DUF2520 domain-containing protein [Robiginitalea myxolifaciens]